MASDLNFSVAGSIKSTVHSNPGANGKYYLCFNGTPFASDEGNMASVLGYWCSSEVAELVGKKLDREIDIKAFKRHYSTFTSWRTEYGWRREVSERIDDTLDYVRGKYRDIYHAVCELQSEGAIRNEPSDGKFYYVINV